MAFAPLRFLHAADVRLDQAIGEIPKLPPRLASIVQDATRAAFDRLIALAIEHEVDFVLLAGNTFVEADKSLAGRLALLDAFEQLNKSDIRRSCCPDRSTPSTPGSKSLICPKMSHCWRAGRGAWSPSNATIKSSPASGPSW